MTTYTDSEELGTPSHPYLLVQRLHSAGPASVPGEDLEPPVMDLSAIHGDRMAPAMSGILAGFVGGAVALGVVHGLQPHVLARSVAAVAEARTLDPAVALGIAYGTAASIGALVGATFAVVTRYLRKWGPLLIWALVFFVSLSMLILAAPTVYGRAVSSGLSAAILAASAAFAVVFSFSLPIRRRH